MALSGNEIAYILCNGSLATCPNQFVDEDLIAAKALEKEKKRRKKKGERRKEKEIEEERMKERKLGRGKIRRKERK